MNLWVKRTGQLLLAALFLIACEDDSFLLGFKNQNKKFNVGYQEFLIGVAVEPGSNDGEIISIDSIITDNLSSATKRLLVGEYTDPKVGSVKTESFLEFIPSIKPGITKLDATPETWDDYELDSLVLQMRLDYYSYGLESEDISPVSNFKVHELEDTLTYKKDITVKIKNKAGVLVDSVISWYGAKRYYANSTAPYNESEFLGETRLVKLSRVKGEEKYTSASLKLSKLEAGKDTLVAMAHIDDIWANQFFATIRHNTNSVYSDAEKFRTEFNGFALIPSGNDAVLGYNPNDTYSRLVLYYHSNDASGIKKDTLSSIFYPGTSFHKITPTRTAEQPAPEPAYSGVTPVNELLVQNGNPIITKIDLTNFYMQFADTVDEDVIINSAEVLIEPEASQSGYKRISSFELRVMKENDRYADYRLSEDSAFVSGFTGYTLLPQSLHYFVLGDLTGGTSTLSYSSSKEKYSGFATLFFQSLLDRVVENKKTPDSPKPTIRFLGLYPTGDMGKSINRTIFNKSNIKLRIYYTHPNKTNL